MENDDKTITVTASDLEGIVNKILDWGLPVLVFALPLFFLPITADQFELPKQVLALVGTLFLLTATAIRDIIRKKSGYLRTPLNLPVILIPVVAIISAVLNPTVYSSLIATAYSLLPMVLTFFLVAKTVDSWEKSKIVMRAAVLSAMVLSFWTMFCFVLFLVNKVPVVAEVFSRLPAQLAVLLSLNFSFSGSVFAQVFFAAALLPVLFINRQDKFSKFALIVILAGLAINAFTLYVSRPVFLPLFASWKIATGVIGTSGVNALFGTGVDNYLNAFTAFRPLDLNNSQLWNLRYSAAGNFYLQILSTLGVLGLATVVWVVASFIKIMRLRLSLGVTKEWENGLLYAICLIILAWVVLPSPLIVTYLFFVLLGLLFASYRLNEVVALANEKSFGDSTFAKLASTVIPLGLFVGATYFGVRHLLWADFAYARSLQMAAVNNGTETYNMQVMATNLNPFRDQYHLSYSQTNLALADAIAGQAQKDGQALTESQRNTVVQLVQQAIREARLAGAANPGNPANWENLATIYRSLISFAQGADQWTIASQNQAITLDPTNPKLRVDLGGIYYSFGNYNGAAQLFSAATQLKPDYANAHYNLAQAYKMLKATDLAIQSLNNARGLVCQSGQTDDCKKIESEISQLSQTETTKAEEKKPAEIKGSVASPSAANLNRTKSPVTSIATGSGEITP